MTRLFAVLAAALLALGAGNAFAQAAYVHDMTGTATATATAGATPRALKIGDLIESGSTISTGAKSSAVIKFEDGQVMALAENTSFRIVDYRYNKQRVSQSSAVFNLLQGGLRFISGVIGSTNRNNFRMTAGTATIGIRGSDGAVNYDSATQAVLVAVLKGALSLNTQVINVGEFSTATAGQLPTVPQLTKQATPAVQAIVDGLAVRAVPINTPVVVKASAAAAAAVANAVTLANQAAAPGATDAQKAAAAAAKAEAEASLATAIQEAQSAFKAAVDAGAVPAAPPATPPLPQGVTGTTADPSITIDGVTITPSGASGAGGGSTPTPCDPNVVSPC